MYGQDTPRDTIRLGGFDQAVRHPRPERPGNEATASATHGSRPRSAAPWCFGVAVACTAMISGCSTPRTSADVFSIGRAKVVDFVNDAGQRLPRHALLGSETRAGKVVPLGFRTVSEADTDRELCYKHVAGFAYAKTGDRQPELRTIVEFHPGTDVVKLLAPLAQHWKSLKYSVVADGLKARSPQVKATIGDYTLYATALSATSGFDAAPKVTLYAVGRCATTSK